MTVRNILSFCAAVSATAAACAAAEHLPSGLPLCAADISPDAPQWAKQKGAFANIDQSPFNPQFLANNPQLKNIAKERFFPFVDKYGQFIHKDWNGKTRSDADLKTAFDEETKWLAAHENKGGASDAFGGVKCAQSFPKTRRFTTRKIGGKWFFITPDGSPMWIYGINAVAVSNGTRITGRENYFQSGAFDDKRFQLAYPFDRKKSLFFNFEAKNKSIKYPDEAAYLARAKRRLEAWGFNAIGSWSNPDFVKSAQMPFFAVCDAAYPKLLSFDKSAKLGHPAPDYFDAAFAVAQAKEISKIKELANSPYCVGVFVGYKIRWQWQKTDIAAQILASPATQASKIKFAEILKKKYGEISSLNKAWKTSYANWEAFLAERSVPEHAAKADMEAMKKAYYERFYGVCAELLDAAAPNVLYLGTRFQEYPQDADIVRAAAKFADAISVVSYFENPREMKLPPDCADKPIIVCEFNFCPTDRGVFGGGFNPCATTAESVAKFAQFVRGALANPNIAGVLYMRWSDCPTSAKHNGENTASGFLDICDTPIYPMCEMSAKLGSEPAATVKTFTDRK